MLEGFGVETFAQLAPEAIPSPYGFGWDVILPRGKPGPARQCEDRRFTQIPLSANGNGCESSRV